MKNSIKDLLQTSDGAEHIAAVFPAADKRTGERIYKSTMEKLSMKRSGESTPEIYAVTRAKNLHWSRNLSIAAAAFLTVGLVSGGVILSMNKKTVHDTEEKPVIVEENSQPFIENSKELSKSTTAVNNVTASTTHTAVLSGGIVTTTVSATTAPVVESEGGMIVVTTFASPSAMIKDENTTTSKTIHTAATTTTSASSTPSIVSGTSETTDLRLLYIRKNGSATAPLVKESEVIDNDLSFFQTVNLLSLRKREQEENCTYDWLEHEFLSQLNEYDEHVDLPLMLELIHEAMGDYDLTVDLLSYRQPYPDKTYTDKNGDTVYEYWMTDCDSVTVTLFPSAKKMIYRGPDLNEKKTVNIERELIGTSDSFMNPFAPASSIERRQSLFNEEIEAYKDYYPNGAPLRKLMTATGVISPDKPRLTMDKFNKLLETCESKSELWSTLYADYVPDVAGHYGQHKSGQPASSNYEYWFDDEGTEAIVITLSGEYYYVETTYGCIPGECYKLTLPW